MARSVSPFGVQEESLSTAPQRAMRACVLLPSSPPPVLQPRPWEGDRAGSVAPGRAVPISHLPVTLQGTSKQAGVVPSHTPHRSGGCCARAQGCHGPDADDTSPCTYRGHTHTCCACDLPPPAHRGQPGHPSHAIYAGAEEQL